MENSSESPSNHQSKKIKTTHHVQTSCDAETPFLLEEIIIEILARLPVKSLMKFRCVSKSWLSIISSPRFVKFHLEISRKDTTFSKHRTMFTITDPHFHLKQCSVRSLVLENSADVFDVEYPDNCPHRAVWVVGSCNGLICIAINEKRLFLWNPSTRISTRLPLVSIKMKPGYYNLYGFGYCERSDDYKVLAIFCEFGNGGIYESNVMMYSLRSNSWKRIEDFKGGVPLDESGLFASGRLHFSRMAPTNNLNFRWDIVSIDLDTEVYGTVEQPNYEQGCYESSLGVLGEFICVLCNYQYVRADLWVLKEYGVKESWIKTVSIPYIGDPGKFLYSRPLLMLPNGEILLVFAMHPVIYNPKNNSLRQPETRNLSTFLEADIYIESLVSPVSS